MSAPSWTKNDAKLKDAEAAVDKVIKELPLPATSGESETAPRYHTTLGGIELVLESMLSCSIMITDRSVYGPSSGTVGSFAWSFAGFEKGLGSDAWTNTFESPLPQIISDVREIMFRSSVAIAQRRLGKWTPDPDNPKGVWKMSSDAPTQVLSSPATMNIYHTVYRTNRTTLGIAISLMGLVVLAMVPLYWHYWKLGRKVSMSPIEIAKALHNTPLSYGQDQEKATSVLDAVGPRMKARYGSNLDAGKLDGLIGDKSISQAANIQATHVGGPSHPGPVGMPPKRKQIGAAAVRRAPPRSEKSSIAQHQRSRIVVLKFQVRIQELAYLLSSQGQLVPSAPVSARQIPAQEHEANPAEGKRSLLLTLRFPHLSHEAFAILGESRKVRGTIDRYQKIFAQHIQGSAEEDLCQAAEEEVHQIVEQAAHEIVRGEVHSTVERLLYELVEQVVSDLASGELQWTVEGRAKGTFKEDTDQQTSSVAILKPSARIHEANRILSSGPSFPLPPEEKRRTSTREKNWISQHSEPIRPGEDLDQEVQRITTLKFPTRAIEVERIVHGIRSFPKVSIEGLGRSNKEGRSRRKTRPKERLLLNLKLPQAAYGLPVPSQSFGQAPTRSGRSEEEMAPVEKANVNDELKSVIHHLYEFQLIANGYQPESNKQLERKVHEIATALGDLSSLTLPAENDSSTTTASIQYGKVPAEILDYVDSGRNPDIYTREFVEVVQKGNATLNGRRKAFGSFAQILGEEMREHMPETKNEVDKVLNAAGLDRQEKGTIEATGERNGN
ncbi:MAG: hypothetical protein Q9227_001750 [Pyrenula ochraceoflavens]